MRTQHHIPSSHRLHQIRHSTTVADPNPENDVISSRALTPNRSRSVTGDRSPIDAIVILVVGCHGTQFQSP